MVDHFHPVFTRTRTNAQWATEAVKPLPNELCLNAETDSPRKLVVGNGTTSFADLPNLLASGGGSGNPSSGSSGQIQLSDGSGGFSSMANFLASNSVLYLPTAGMRINDAGAVTSPWAPPGNNGCIIKATVSGNLTINAPSGLTPLSGYRTEFVLELTNSSSTAFANLTFSGYSVKFIQPFKALNLYPNETRQFYIGTDNGGSTWYVYGQPPAFGDIKGFFSGSIPAGSCLLAGYLHGGGVVPHDKDDVGLSYLLQAPNGGSAIFEVKTRDNLSTPWTVRWTYTFQSGQDWPAIVYSNPSNPYTVLPHGGHISLWSGANMNGAAGLSFNVRYRVL